MTVRIDETEPKNKNKYQVFNQKEYNQALMNHGMLWFDEQSVRQWYQGKSKEHFENGPSCISKTCPLLNSTNQFIENVIQCGQFQ